MTFIEFLLGRYPVVFDQNEIECFLFQNQEIQAIAVTVPIDFMLNYFGEVGQIAINEGQTPEEIVAALLEFEPLYQDYLF